MSVTYQFRTKADVRTVDFDGMAISVAELKRNIRQSIDNPKHIAIVINDPKTGSTYDSDQTLIPSQTHVEVVLRRKKAKKGTQVTYKL
ncbi:unnamed protein product [Oppiella nova]|uniref:DWNN domain-containing protein n=1 Tax=Oppiella nova TaxID=334625 RepID=A0A7R9QNX6_9ACAR|nr:unnamed protein product [Oppiella nova]CAG2169622.1 unnamed protein product [Oppiella nova]